MQGASKNPLHNSDAQTTVDRVSKALGTFFEQINKILTDEEKNQFAFTNGGMSIMIALFERVLSRLNSIPRDNDIVKYVTALHQTLASEYPHESDRKKLRLRITSEGGKDELIEAFVLSIRGITGDTSFGGVIQVTDFNNEVIQFEREFAKFLFQVLEIQSIDDLQKHAPPDVCGKLRKRRDSDLAKGIQKNDFSEDITLGECLTILNYDDNWGLFKLFLVESEPGFNSIDETKAALQSITKFRANTLHGKAVSPKYKDRELNDIYLDKLNKCIEDFNNSGLVKPN